MELLRLVGISIGGRFGQSLIDVVGDTKNWSTSKERSGEGWEPLFLLVLWLRYAAFGGSDDFSFAPSTQLGVHDGSITTRLFYNYPVIPDPLSISTIKNHEELQRALNEISQTNEWTEGPKFLFTTQSLLPFRSTIYLFVCGERVRRPSLSRMISMDTN